MPETPRHDVWLDIASSLLNEPTAPVMEDLPRQHIRDFAAARNLKLTEDAAGNLLLQYGKAKKGQPSLVLVGHIDHPGFAIRKVQGNTAELEFRGWVMGPHAQLGTKVRFYERGKQQSVGVGELTEIKTAKAKMAAENAPQRVTAGTARIVEGVAPKNGFTMWDFPGFSIADGKIVTRCCDDLLGSAAALCTIDEIARRKPKNIALNCLFTRAEEVGFFGTLEAIRLKTLAKNSCVLSLETSKAFAHAPQGNGVIVRVGDATSIFDRPLTDALCQAAKRVQAKDTNFKWQRKLMDGGTCEATPFCMYGYRASGIAVPLGNYHNQGFDAAGNPCIGPETVVVTDFLGEVQLLVELALHPEWLTEQPKVMPKWLTKLERDARRQLKR